jgi:IclR family acetate operon transcriptional repressor
LILKSNSNLLQWNHDGDQMTFAAVERTLTVVEALAGQPAPLELSDLAARADLPVSAVHRTLATLVARGWVFQDPNSQNYALSLRMPMLAFRALDSRSMPDVLQDALDRLANSTQEYCRLALLESDRLTWVARAQGAQCGLRYDPAMGGEIVLHATANGKAWLSTLPEDKALELATVGLSQAADTGPKVLNDPAALLAALRETRVRGWATSIEEAEAGTSAVAVPVRCAGGPDAPVVGTISVAGPSLRITLDRIEGLATALHATAAEIGQLWPMHLHQMADGATDTIAQAAE